MSAVKPKNNYKAWILPSISVVTLIVPVVIQIGSATCDNEFLKGGVLVFLTISFVLTCFIIHRTSKDNVKLLNLSFYVVCFLFYFLVACYVFTKKCDQTIAAKANPSINVNNSDNSVHNRTYNDNRKTYNYNKHSTRTINTNDIVKLKSELRKKDDQILVQYLESKPEDTLMWSQVYKMLLKIGYSDVTRSSATKLPDNLQSGRITILKLIIDTNTQYRVIINPQQ